jgi:hypothetical protein
MSKPITLPDDPVQRLTELKRLEGIAENEQKRVELGQQIREVDLEIHRAELAVLDKFVAEQRLQEQKETEEFERKTRADLYNLGQFLVVDRAAAETAERTQRMIVIRKQTEYLEQVLQRSRENKGTGVTMDRAAVDRQLDRIARGVETQPEYLVHLEQRK